jgi:hypothetical protein
MTEEATDGPAWEGAMARGRRRALRHGVVEIHADLAAR